MNSHCVTWDSEEVGQRSVCDVWLWALGLIPTEDRDYSKNNLPEWIQR